MSCLVQSVSSTQDVCRKASSHSFLSAYGHRVFRRYPYADMYVVYTDRSLHQLQLIHLKQPLYDVPDFCTAFPVQDFFSIFWYKYYVVYTIPLCMCRTFLLHFFVSCVLVRDALLPLLHFITGDFFLLNYCPCKTHCRTTGRACGFLLVLNAINFSKSSTTKIHRQI